MTTLSSYFRHLIVNLLPQLTIPPPPLPSPNLPRRSAQGVIGARLCCCKRSSAELLRRLIGLSRRLLKLLDSSVRCRTIAAVCVLVQP